MLRRAGEATHDLAISNHLARTPFNLERELCRELAAIIW